MPTAFIAYEFLGVLSRGPWGQRLLAVHFFKATGLIEARINWLAMLTG